MKDLLLKSLLKSKANKELSLEELIDKFLQERAGEAKKQTKEFLSNLVSFLMQNLESIDKEHLLKLIEKKIEQFNLSVNINDIEEIYTKNATIVAQSVGLNFSFDKIDTRVIDSLYNSFVWMGEDASKETQAKLKDTITKALSGDIEIDKLGEALKDEFESISDANAKYFQGVSDHIISQMQVVNRVNTYAEAGYKYYKISAIIDERTSNICRSMNGRVIEIDRGLKQAKELTDAKSVADRKEASPWQNSAIFGKLPKGVAMPPFHFRCRTTIVAYEPIEHTIDGKKVNGTYSPDDVFTSNKEKKRVVFSHIDNFGAERVLTAWGKKHIAKHNIKDKDIIAGLNSLSDIALHGSEPVKVVAYSRDKNIFFVFEGQEIITVYKPRNKLSYFNKNADSKSIESKTLKKGAEA